MDNVTHSLVGYALGKALPQSPQNQRFERAAIWTAVLGSNIPDLDFIFPLLIGDGKLGYLLHHRGHTHTILFALLQGVLAAGIGVRVARPERRHWSLLCLLGIITACLHIGMDYWNSYGVHPFWPWDNRWFYGDFIFIVEPLIWIMLIPFAFGETPKRPLKAGFGVLLSGVFLLQMIGPFRSNLTLLVSIGALLFSLGTRYGARRIGVRPVWPALANLGGVLFAFWIGSSQASLDILQNWKFAKAEGEVLGSLSIHPQPANPLCWGMILVTENQATNAFRVRLGVTSIAPHWVLPKKCLSNRGIDGKTAPLALPSLSSTKGVLWQEEFSGTSKEFRKLAAENCHFRALLQFSRSPFWMESRPGYQIFGDLRFDRRRSLDFSEIEVGSDSFCPRFLPPWIRPLQNLFTSG